MSLISQHSSSASGAGWAQINVSWTNPSTWAEARIQQMYCVLGTTTAQPIRGYLETTAGNALTLWEQNASLTTSAYYWFTPDNPIKVRGRETLRISATGVTNQVKWNAGIVVEM